MGLSYSFDLENTSNDVMMTSNNQIQFETDGCGSEQSQLLQALTRMGFDNKLVLSACDQYKKPEHLQNAITYVLSQKKSKCTSGQYYDYDDNDLMTSAEFEIDEDGYYKLVDEQSLNSNNNSSNNNDNNYNKLRSSTSLIEDEVIRFHMDIHKESIEEQRIINKMAQQYEQERIYAEMLENEEKNNIKQCIFEIQQHLQFLQSSFHSQCQFLYQTYQMKLIENKNMELIQNEFQNKMRILNGNYLKQKEFLDKNKCELQKLFDSYNKKYDIVCNNEIKNLTDLNINDVPGYIPSYDVS